MKRAWAVLAILSLALVIAGCGKQSSNQPAPQSNPKAKKVAVLFPGVVYDHSWNQWGLEGLNKARDTLGCQVAYTEKVSQDAQIEVFRNYAQQGYNVIIGHGGEYMDAAEAVASEFPDTQFVVTNGSRANGKNVTSIQVSYPHQGYLAGVLAGEMSKTKKVAVIMAEPIPLAQAGVDAFKAGVERTGKGVSVQVVKTGSWDDVNKAREAALTTIAGGTDVLWHILDTADVGVLTAAQDKKVMAIGLYSDQSATAPQAVIGSATGSPGTLIYAAASGEMLNGKVNSVGVEYPDGVKMVYSTTISVSQQAKDAVDAAAKDLASGKVKFEVKAQTE